MAPSMCISLNDSSDVIDFVIKQGHGVKVVNHGVPLQVFDNVKKATYDFFGLPAEEKIKYSKENSSSNNVRFGTSFIPHAENALEWKDYLSLFYVSEDEVAALWLSDKVGGLYVRGIEGQVSWIHVRPINGAIVINIRDVLQIMSNGRYRSVEHRIIANGSSNRILVPIFVNPRPQDTIGPLLEALANGEKPIDMSMGQEICVKELIDT
ncbi:hypothetical protein Dsin_008770 [Dipteronia sinensis]|uniref:Isopenicillin N synthase-like Fe(2+) 2OG dioxygenase domain-containing protein n=1 Tax=Dipteronia sinensis TaxID=43782 RepID=A0AAE0AQ77_9ROSI|nr:hypothetical protein Dsin_008770 [Dipteronia sinensis]